MHAKDNNGVLFYETICSFREQRHTFIEAVPLPFEQFQDAPAYFRVRPLTNPLTNRWANERNQSWPLNQSGHNTRNLSISQTDQAASDGH